ncbi:polyhomeotic-like protein 2 isoform X10 [Branchiostoma lanceolatum]|uniref:polyhomeotic-like protein 2 isoform X10 n=1 Tax=Branchiostoma lanceolatum TaxID=7740 RepID=UPI0034521484
MNDRQTSPNVPTTQQPPAAHQSHSAPSLASQVQQVPAALFPDRQVQVIQQALHRGQPVTSVSAAQYSALQQMYMQQQLLLQNMAAQQQALGSSAVGQHGLSLTQANRQVLTTQSGTVTSQAQLLTTPAALQLLGPRMAAAAGAGGLSLSQPLQLVGQAGQPLYTTCTPQQLHSVLLQAQQAQSAAASQQAQAATAQLQKQAAASMAQQQASAQLALGPATSSGSTGSSSTPSALLSQLPSRGQGSVQALPLRGPPVPPTNQSKPSQSKQLDQSEKRVSTSPKKTDSSTVEKSKSQSSHPVPQAIAIGQPSSAKSMGIQLGASSLGSPPPPEAKSGHIHHVHPHVQPPVQPPPQPVQPPPQPVQAHNQPVQAHNQPVQAHNPPMQAHNPPMQAHNPPGQAHNPPTHAVQAAHVPPTHVQAAHVQPTHVQPLSQPLPLALATHKPVQTAPPLPQQPPVGPSPVAQPSAMQQSASRPRPSALSVLPSTQPSQRQIPTPGPQSRLTPPPAQPQRPQSLPPPVSTSAVVSQQAPPRVPSPKQNGVTVTTAPPEKPDDPMKSPEPPKDDPPASRSSDLPLALNKPPTEKQQPQRAVVKPQILTHLIDGFIIQEGPQPFPIKHNSILVESRRPQASLTAPEAGPSTENGSALLIHSPDGKQPSKKPKKPQDKTLLKCEFCGKVDYQYRFRGSKRWLIFYTKRFCSMACAKRYNVGCTKRLGLFTPKQPSRYISKKKRERKSSSRKSTSGSEVSPSRLYSASLSPEPEDVQMSEPMDFSPPHEQLSPRASLSSPSRIVNRHNSFGSTDNELDLGPSDPNPARWSVEEVWEFIRSLPGCSDFADEFRSQEIDGQALMLLKEDHLMSAMNMKLGPALKICARINSLKQDS